MKTLAKLKPKVSILDDKFFVFDVETKGLRAKSDVFIFGVIYGFNYLKILYNVEDFKNEFKKDIFKKKIIFAHNAEYDLSVIYDNIYVMDNKTIFNNRFISCSNNNCIFADSFNIFPTSVKKLGELIGLEKKEIEQQYITGEKITKVTKRMINYCIRDCEIVYKSLLKFFELTGGIKITLASISLMFFRRNFQQFHIDYNEQLTEYFFKSYYGGRVECFKLGKVKANVYDINSIYPYCMLQNFPNPKFLKYRSLITPKIFINKYLYSFEGCGYFEIEHKKCYFGFLPYKYNNKLIFPIGKIEGVWNFNEIRFALNNKMIKIIKIKYIIFAPHMKSPFINFVNDIYKLRQNTNDKFEKLLYKLELNSLYGKFAQKIKYEFIYIKDYNLEINKINEYEENNLLLEIKFFNALRKDCFLKVKTSKVKFIYNSIPVFSSYITSYARIFLLQNLLNNKRNNPVYCDTDSIFFEKKPNLDCSKNELGKWKKEDKIITEIRGLKNYKFILDNKEQEKIKGVPKNAKKTGMNEYSYQTLLKTREALIRNLPPGILTNRKKILSLVYDKREILENGNTYTIRL